MFARALTTFSQPTEGEVRSCLQYLLNLLSRETGKSAVLANPGVGLVWASVGPCRWAVAGGLSLCGPDPMPVRMVKRPSLQQSARKPAAEVPSPLPAALIPCGILAGHSWRIRAVAIAPDGTWIASASSDKTVWIWSANDGLLHAKLSGHTDAVTCVAIGPCGSWVASGGSDRSLRLWSLPMAPRAVDDRCPLVIDAAHTREVTSVAINSTGTTLVSGSEDKLVKLWHVESEDGGGKTCALSLLLRGHTDSISSVAVASTWLASASWDGTVRLWSTAGGDGGPFQVLEQHETGVTALALSPAADLLASGSRDGTVFLWSVSSERGRCTPTVGLTCRIRAHTDKVASIAWAPRDGRWVATGGRDDHVRVHCARTGAMLCEDKAHTDNVAGLAAGPDGRWLVSGAHDHTVRLWRLGSVVGAAAAS